MEVHVWTRPSRHKHLYIYILCVYTCAALKGVPYRGRPLYRGSLCRGTPRVTLYRGSPIYEYRYIAGLLYLASPIQGISYRVSTLQGVPYIGAPVRRAHGRPRRRKRSITRTITTMKTRSNGAEAAADACGINMTWASFKGSSRASFNEEKERCIDFMIYVYLQIYIYIYASSLLVGIPADVS